MQCYIYRSSIKEGLYVYLSNEDGLVDLPEPVKRQLGTPEFSMSLDLQPDRKLGQEDTRVVLENLKTQGFHIQMPRDIEQQLKTIASTATSREAYKLAAKPTGHRTGNTTGKLRKPD